jgi:ATP-dependent DNA helicase RecG
MNAQDLVALVDQLRALPTETEWLEFRCDNADPQGIGEYLSALANEACLCN